MTYFEHYNELITKQFFYLMAIRKHQSNYSKMKNSINAYVSKKSMNNIQNTEHSNQLLTNSSLKSGDVFVITNASLVYKQLITKQFFLFNGDTQTPFNLFEIEEFN